MEQITYFMISKCVLCSEMRKMDVKHYEPFLHCSLELKMAQQTHPLLWSWRQIQAGCRLCQKQHHSDQSHSKDVSEVASRNGIGIREMGSPQWICALNPFFLKDLFIHFKVRRRDFPSSGSHSKDYSSHGWTT